MKREKQIIAIALYTRTISELWRRILVDEDRTTVSVPSGRFSKSILSKAAYARQVEIFLHQMPDYTRDLNAMHEAEAKLSSEQWETYCRELYIVCEGRSGGKGYLFASAAQRAEAFLKVIGKWIHFKPRNSRVNIL